jgi:predicted ArsR family transcriptional regulator
MSEPLARKVGQEGIETAAALTDPVRRRLYDLAVEAVGPIGRDEAAAVAGIGRSLAGYHLDQLVEDGLLEASYARRGGRSGPGAGRPAKFYAPAPVEVTVQLPPRDDTFVAHLLATAIETDGSGVAREALRVATRAAGRALGWAFEDGTTDAMVEALEARGYSPLSTEEGIRLRNCPFHHLVDNHTDLVCSLNADLLGSAAEAGKVGFVAVLDPQPGMCCVVLRPESHPGAATG